MNYTITVAKSIPNFQKNRNIKKVHISIKKNVGSRNKLYKRNGSEQKQPTAVKNLIGEKQNRSKSAPGNEGIRTK